MWDEPRKRTLSQRERKLLYERAGRKCEACGKPLNFIDMIPGHKNAYSRGGSTTLRNSVCICNSCNVLQGTDSWSAFMKKLGKSSPSNQAKETLKTLTVTQLKELARTNRILVRGRKEEDWYGTTIKTPAKAQYVSAISKKVTLEDINEFVKNNSTPRKKKKKRSTY